MPHYAQGTATPDDPGETEIKHLKSPKTHLDGGIHRRVRPCTPTAPQHTLLLAQDEFQHHSNSEVTQTHSTADGQKLKSFDNVITKPPPEQVQNQAEFDMFGWPSGCQAPENTPKPPTQALYPAHDDWSAWAQLERGLRQGCPCTHGHACTHDLKIFQVHHRHASAASACLP